MKRPRKAYLDVAAAAAVSGKAKDAFVKNLRLYGNPSAMHQEGREAKAVLEEARKRIARVVEAKPEHIVFTSGATEANTLALVGHVRALEASGRSLSSVHLLYHPGSHASLVRTMEALKSEGADVEELPLTGAAVDTGALTKKIKEETVLISLEAVSPDTGMRHDVRAVRTTLDEALDGKGRSILLHVDASQLPLVEPALMTRVAADFMTLDAQKIGGVRGVGVLVRTARTRLVPVVHGGGQERGLRSGTEPVALAASFAEALEETQSGCEAFSLRATKERENLIASMQIFKNMVVLGGKTPAPHILSVAFPGKDTDYLVALLDEAGISVSTKSACESASEDGSRMAFLETGDPALALSTLRISWGPQTKKRELDAFFRALTKALSFLDRNPL